MRADRIDFEALSRQLVAEVRGNQSTRAASLRLGYTSNPVLRWECGDRVPPAGDVLLLAHLRGRDVVGAARMLTNGAAARIGELTPRDPGFVPAIVASYAEGLGRSGLAEVTGLSVQQIGRLVRGEARMRLPDLLRMMQTVNRTMVSFLGYISDLTKLPDAEEAWTRRDREQQLVSDMPFAFMVRYALELEAYRSLPAHDDAWLAAYLGLPEDDVARCLARLAYLGTIEQQDGRWVPAPAYGLGRHRWPEAVERRVSAQLIEEAARRVRGGLATSAWSMFRTDDATVRRVAVALARALDEGGDAMASERGEGDRIGYAVALLVPMDGRPFQLREEAAEP